MSVGMGKRYHKEREPQRGKVMEEAHSLWDENVEEEKEILEGAGYEMLNKALSMWSEIAKCFVSDYDRGCGCGNLNSSPMSFVRGLM